ncbi:MAG: hypothetical protein ACI91F_003322, partial [Candidatus Binatia bacterium]
MVTWWDVTIEMVWCGPDRRLDGKGRDVVGSISARGVEELGGLMAPGWLGG